MGSRPTHGTCLVRHRRAALPRDGGAAAGGARGAGGGARLVRRPLLLPRLHVRLPAVEALLPRSLAIAHWRSRVPLSSAAARRVLRAYTSRTVRTVRTDVRGSCRGRPPHEYGT